MMKFLESTFKHTIAFLEKTKPDVIFYSVIATLPAYVLYRVAEKKGIRNIILSSTRLGNKFTFSYDTFTGMNKALDDFEEKNIKEKYKTEAIEYLKNYRLKGEKPGYVPTAMEEGRKRISPINQTKSVLRGIKNILYYNFTDQENSYIYHGVTVSNLIREVLKTNEKIRKTRNIKFEDPKDEDYVYFPMHLQPEMTTMVMAPMYLDQFTLIENIAKSLPISIKLYVKEHPYSVLTGKNDPESYERLEKIPNLRFIRPDIPSKDLVEKSKGVLVITGTAGLEALMLKKPVITFGNVFFNKLKMVKKLKNINDLPYLVKDIIDNPGHDDGELINFMAAIFQNSFEADLTRMYTVSPVSTEQILKHKDFPIFVENFAKELGISMNNPKQ